MMHDGWMFGMGWFWILVVVLLVAAVWFAVRAGSSSRGPGGAPRYETPEEVLRGRLARGEIDEEEYRSRMKTLSEKR
jgi:putative membrane protein